MLREWTETGSMKNPSQSYLQIRRMRTLLPSMSSRSHNLQLTPRYRRPNFTACPPAGPRNWTLLQSLQQRALFISAPLNDQVPILGLRKVHLIGQIEVTCTCSHPSGSGGWGGHGKNENVYMALLASSVKPILSQWALLRRQNMAAHSAEGCGQDGHFDWLVQHNLITEKVKEILSCALLAWCPTRHTYIQFRYLYICLIGCKHFRAETWSLYFYLPSAWGTAWHIADAPKMSVEFNSTCGPGIFP